VGFGGGGIGPPQGPESPHPGPQEGLLPQFLQEPQG
jgi:hypothetical protein